MNFNIVINYKVVFQYPDFQKYFPLEAIPHPPIYDVPTQSLQNNYSSPLPTLRPPPHPNVRQNILP